MLQALTRALGTAELAGGARGFFHAITHPEAGAHCYPGHPFTYPDRPLRFDTPAPCLGDCDEVRFGRLGA